MLSQFLLQTTTSKETLSFGGNKNKELPRCRKDIEKDIFRPLGDYNFRRAYRMKKLTFYKLHSLLQPLLLRQFFPKRGGNRHPRKNSYLINTEIRLSIALRYFAGGSPLDIMMVHGVSFTSVFSSVWGVVDVVNSCTKLSFEFPSHEDQTIIANDFSQRSGANFGNVVGEIDGILIWILKPNSQICRQVNLR